MKVKIFIFIIIIMFFIGFWVSKSSIDNSSVNNLTPKKIIDMFYDGNIDINFIWGELGIKSEVFKYSSQPGKIEEFNINIQNGTGTILAISADNDQVWQYLIFKNVNRKSRFVGYIDFPINQHGVRPEFSVVNLNGQDSCLRINALTATGIGYKLYEQIWYYLGEEQISEVLNFPTLTYNYERPEFSSYEIHGKVLNQDNVNDNYHLELNFTKDSFEKDRAPQSVHEDKVMVYNWDPKNKKFVFDNQNSTWESE